MPSLDSSHPLLEHLLGPGLFLAIAAIWFWVARSSRVARERRRQKALAAGIIGPETMPLPRSWAWGKGLASAVVLAAVYLLIFRGVSFLPWFNWDHKGGAVLMSFSFLFLGPFLAGFLTVTQASHREPWSLNNCIMMPWIPLFINILLALSLAWEGIICVVFIVPPAMLAASLGGIAAGSLQRYLHRQASRNTMLCLAALPLLLAMVETRLHQPLQTRTVDTSVIIHAPLPIVWQNIERVRAIDPSELRASWANTIGFPRPVEATLSHEGVGGVRNASFERGLNFTETVYTWEPNRRIAFTIQADTSAIPSTTLDEHVTVGGRFFDVLTGEYDLTPLPNGDTLLHLSSQERLSTDFNAYAAMWSDAVMRDMQTNILHVVQNRCEAQAAGQPVASLKGTASAVPAQALARRGFSR